MTHNHALGVRCPSCGGTKSRVLEARPGRGYVRRRHACLEPACAEVVSEKRIAGRLVTVQRTRWTTYEFLSPRRGAITVPRDIRACRTEINRGQVS